MTNSKKKGKIIYILSAGHSGSTLLDLAIGSIQGVFSTGELVYLPWQLQRGPNKEDKQTYCSCGKDFNECPTWNTILTSLEKADNKDIYGNPESLRISMHQPMAHGRSKPALLIQAAIMTASRSPLTRWVNSFFYGFYSKSVKNSWDLADQICDSTGSDYIVDSSKNIIRYMFLRKYRPDDIKLVVLKRDIRGVASSLHDGPLTDEVIAHRTNAWAKLYKGRVRNVLSQLGNDDYRIIRYEDFCAAPEEKLNQFARWLHLPDDMTTLKINTHNTHLVAGNPIRHTGEINIRKDTRWKDRLTEQQADTLAKVAKDVDNSLSNYV